MTDELQIGHHIVPVEVVDPLEIGGDRFGEYVYEKSLIRVNKDCSPTVTVEVILHEALHCMFDVAGIGLTEKKEEKVVKALAPILGMFIRDNPEFMKMVWLTLQGEDECI